MTYAKILSRLKNRFTTPYYTEDGGNIDKLMQIRATEIVELSGVADDVVVAHQLSNATGHSLDQHGVLLQVVRETDETDARYRTRLLAWSLIYRRSGTLEDVMNTLTTILSSDPTTLIFEDGFDAMPAYFKVWILLKDIVDAGYDIPDMNTLMDQIKAAGTGFELIPYGSIVSGQTVGLSAEYMYAFGKHIGTAEMTDSYSKLWDAERTETESINISDDNNHYHYIDVTYTDSLNIIT